MANHTIQYGKSKIDRKLEYANRKSLGISVYPDSSVIVRAPVGSDLKNICTNVEKRASWII
jgi:hypothetical protein